MPIGDYGFLSDGEVSALVAPGGSVDWMCVPRFDSPQRLRRDPRPARRLVPGRAAGRHGAGRPPLPARDDDPGDQLGHADRLDHRARRAADRAVAPRGRPVRDLPAHARTTTRPSTSCCAPSAASPARCRRSWTASRCSTTAARPSAGTYTGDGYHQGRADRRGLRRRADPDHRHAARLRGRPGQRPHPAQGGRRPLRRAVVGRRRAAHDLRRRLPAAGVDRPPLAALAGPRQVPRPPVAQLPAAQRADPARASPTRRPAR